MAVDETHLTQIYSALDDLRTIGRTQGETLAALAQHKIDLDGRLFGTNTTPGILQHLAGADKKNADDIKAISDDVVALKSAKLSKHAYIAGYAGGAGFIGGIFIKAITYLKTGHF